MIVVTGTHAYGPAREESDIDIAMTVEDSLELKEQILKLDIEMFDSIEINEDCVGFTFEIPGLPPINIISCPTAIELESWRHATDKMKELANPELDRELRVATFDKIRREFLNDFWRKRS